MNNLFLGNTPVIADKQEVKGQFVQIDGEKYYQIANYDQMQPFFISIASNSDHWMYISSTGALSAGRKSPDQALFPYYTDDKITESAEITGSKTILHVKKDGKIFLWEPFSDRNNGVYQLERDIYKSVVGNKIIFSEKNKDLGLSFSYAWMNADEFGWIKKSCLTNNTQQKLEVTILDGIQNVLPSGTDRLTQNTFSTLVDAYKKTELVENTSLALFRMEAIMVDRAEPSESLKANIVWNYGLDNPRFLLSSRQLDAFRKGEELTPEKEAKGVRGAFFAYTTLSLSGNETKTWYLVAEVNQDAVKVNNLLAFFKETTDIAATLEKSIEKGADALKEVVAAADGVQVTADENGMARHFANTLFNTMRGGIYCDDYTIDATNFKKHVQLFNKKVWEKHAGFLQTLPASINYNELDTLVKEQNDINLYRLFQEYLPLTFGRRHGDPSRPWNLFNIKVTDDNGNKLISYQGNWRDIFQNWEALSLSYPAYINGIIAKFLNATTADGYNPYKVTSEGFDWEVIEPENPWSNIGYWGDHQIIYLLKLMELSQDYYPERLQSWLNKEMFAYANVPYKLKSYKEIVADPKNSIVFDEELHKKIEQLVPSYGADAKLKLDENGNVVLATFTEKVLTTFLAKLSNFIPEAGIWMNTLRPEWNDANNALVGYGASMVTLYYMRRFVSFLQALYRNSSEGNFVVSQETDHFFNGIFDAFKQFENTLSTGFNNKQRRAITDALGIAGEKYRTEIYNGFSGSRVAVSKKDLDLFFSLVLKFIDESINANKLPNGMYQAYNIVSFTTDSIEVSHLYEMLEGQVAVLSSGKLSPKEAVELLDSLRTSSLYREDQESYILYPNKQLPLFLEKNVIQEQDINRIPLLKTLVDSGNTDIVAKDKKGQYHFNGNFNNADFLSAALNKMPEVSADQRQEILDLYESIFNHKAFTGRSGTFYKYEGLGSIYWHMVSKLLLAISENIQSAIEQGADADTIDKLKAHYDAVKKGIGAHKQPAEYGSFPFDAYSHTPMMAGVQQPGMTGQVKEDVINRFFELGVYVKDGQISIKPDMLKKQEFIDGKKLQFTCCSIPFTYTIDGQTGIEVVYTGGQTGKTNGYTLSKEESLLIFNRDHSVKEVIIHFDKL